MDSVFDQIRTSLANADESHRRDILGRIRKVQAEFEPDFDVFMRLLSGPLQMSLVKIGVDLKIFEILTSSKCPVTLDDLVKKTGAASQLLGRLLRSMAAFGQIQETGIREYGPSAFSRFFSDPNAAASIRLHFDVSDPVTRVMPAFLAETKYQDITSRHHTPLQRAFNTDLSYFDWLAAHPNHLSDLSQSMALARPNYWVDHYPVEDRLGPFASDDGTSAPPLFVDLGGGLGQQAILFRNKFPTLTGRVIVQDLPKTLADVRRDDDGASGVEFMPHDFFTPQPVAGARIYYLRHILHDWPDADCARILRNLVPAMAPGVSRLVLDEMVLPEKGLPWQAAYMDLLMLNCLGAVERTAGEWETLLNAEGLEIVEVAQYDPMGHAVIVAVPKQGAYGGN